MWTLLSGRQDPGDQDVETRPIADVEPRPITPTSKPDVGDDCAAALAKVRT
jgi:hypothetical protein